MDKKALTEADIRTKFITPALLGPTGSKWNVMTQLREELRFTRGRVIVRGKTVKRGEAKKADYVLYYKPGIPIAVVEAKDNNYGVGDGMQQALEYAEALDVPFVYSSNGDAFLEHDRTRTTGTVEKLIPLDQFPSAEDLWARYRIVKGYTTAQELVTSQDYYDDASGKSPHYYQQIAINRTVDAIVRGQNRILLVMATGTGKTYTAFQIIWRLWKSGAKKRIFFLVDRKILADQTKINDSKPFGQAMTKITNRTADKAFEIYLSLYQAVTGTDEEQNIYKQFSPDFFDLVVVDECHRGSAAAYAETLLKLGYGEINVTAGNEELWFDCSTALDSRSSCYTAYQLVHHLSSANMQKLKKKMAKFASRVAKWDAEVDKMNSLIEDELPIDATTHTPDFARYQAFLRVARILALPSMMDRARKRDLIVFLYHLAKLSTRKAHYEELADFLQARLNAESDQAKDESTLDADTPARAF